jgi:hypothetical protein
VVVTESFYGLAKNEAEALGMPDVRLVQVPHPLAGAKPDEIEKFAERATQGIVALIGSK